MKIIKSKIKFRYNNVWDCRVHIKESLSDYGSPHLKHSEEDLILEFTLSTKVVNKYFNAYDII